MAFPSLSASQVASFLRHASLDGIFNLAQGLDLATARRLGDRSPAAGAPAPSPDVLGEILGAVPARQGAGAAALARNKDVAREWLRKFVEESDRLPIAAPEGSAAGIEDLYRRFFAPLKEMSGSVSSADERLSSKFPP